MDRVSIQHLLDRFQEGVITREEIVELEKMVASGQVTLEEIESLSGLNDNVLKLSTPEPSSRLDENFYRMLSDEKKVQPGFSWKSFFSWSELAPKLALASVALLLGLTLGYFIRTPDHRSDEISSLSQQVSDLKEMMMLSLLEKESATERLKAVSLTQEMDQASQKVTSALLETLNKDENVNVRLAALEALKPYTADEHVREALVRSIALQESPLVQVALAELMAALQVKSSVQEWEKVLENRQTPPEIRKKIQETIQVLI